MNTNNDKGATNVANDTPAALLPEIGDYVLATKYSDGDPGDPWALGFYAGVTERGRHLVKDSNGNQIRAGGFRRVGRIEQEVGTWLWNNRVALESSPPGTVNLWEIVKRDEPDSTAPAASESRGSVPAAWRYVPLPNTEHPNFYKDVWMHFTPSYKDFYENQAAKYGHRIEYAYLAAPAPPAVASGEPTAEQWKQAISKWNGDTTNDNPYLDRIEKIARELARSAAAKGEG